MLGGCMRMTVSIAVMMLESTGDYQYGLPIMAALIAARWTGNLFNKSTLARAFPAFSCDASCAFCSHGLCAYSHMGG